MTVRNRMVTIFIAIVILEVYQPISAQDDHDFINELMEVSRKHGYSQAIEDKGNDEYTIKFTFNRINTHNIFMDSEGDKKSSHLHIARGR